MKHAKRLLAPVPTPLPLPRLEADDEARSSLLFPKGARRLIVWALGPVVRTLVDKGVSANAITAASLAVGALSGALLAFGHFGMAALATAIASLGDALDGLVARRGRTTSAGGALFDASVDRYEEFFVLGGLAVFLRSRAPLLGLVLLALVGSFMVSYGSAKAEALRVPVPPGMMRRAERAFCLTFGIALVPLFHVLVQLAILPPSVELAPLLAALAVVGLVSNASAIRRLWSIAELADAAEKGRRPVEEVRIALRRR
jgi:CDP-diacylglycerol--glycerol-3-phosphate 3-phosphatidyltransferase